MDLTSLRRVKYALNVTKSDEDSLLSALVGAASKQIAAWLRRLDQSGADALELKSRTEYIDPIPGERVFYPLCYPIASITSIYSDGYGRYTGSEQLIDSAGYYVGSDNRTIVFTTSPSLPDWPGFPCVPRGVRVIYTAGLAADPTISTWTKSADVGGSLGVGKVVRGETTGSLGYTTAAAAGTISIETLSGKFSEETIREYDRVDASMLDGGPKGATGVTATLTACTARSLVESHPALVLACERHVAHWKKNRDSFDNLTVTQDGATRFSRKDMESEYDFLPEIRSLLNPYRNNLVPV